MYSFTGRTSLISSMYTLGHLNAVLYSKSIHNKNYHKYNIILLYVQNIHIIVHVIYHFHYTYGIILDVSLFREV